MTTNKKIESNNLEYKEQFNGKFYGVLRWHQLDDIWEKILKEKSQGWFVYQTEQKVPTKKIYNDELELLIKLIDENLRDQHNEDYCGVVYVDDPDIPAFIKVFDPKNMGTSCSVGGKAPLPEWVISLMQPVDLNNVDEPVKYKKRWFGNLFSK